MINFSLHLILGKMDIKEEEISEDEYNDSFDDKEKHSKNVKKRGKIS